MENVVNRDTKMATELLQLKSRNDKFLKPFYAFTNEFLNQYLKYLKDRKTMLSVIGSGDQIFNAILNGTREVEAFDINRLAKYYFYLKKAAIETLSSEEFIDMFVESRWRECGYREYLERILANLDADIKKFWQYIVTYFGWDWYEIYNSHLFYGKPTNYQIMVANSYLDGKNYKKLKESFKDSEINIRDGNILELVDDYSSRSFNLIYLSNIWNYVDLDEYLKMQRRLKLTLNGCLIAYAFSEYKMSIFKEEGYNVKSLSSKNILMIKTNN